MTSAVLLQEQELTYRVGDKVNTIRGTIIEINSIHSYVKLKTRHDLEYLIPLTYVVKIS